MILPSNVSNDLFQKNKPNKYKVKLPKEIYLVEDEWEVALASISFPDTFTQISPEKQPDYPLCMTARIYNNRNLPRRICSRADTILKSAVPITDGVSYWQILINYVINDFYHHLEAGQTLIRHRTKGIPSFTWRQVGNKQELVIDNSQIQSSANLNFISINMQLALAFNLVKCEVDDKTKKINYKISDSLRMEQFRTVVLKGPYHKIHIDKDSQDSHSIDCRIYKHNDNNTVNKDSLELYGHCNWIISDVNENFENYFGRQRRSLFVYTDLGQTQTVGDTTVNLLREVMYENTFKGLFIFEPHHLHFIPVRKNVFDTVEVSILESDGKEVNFKDEPVILTVKFQKKEKRR